MVSYKTPSKGPGRKKGEGCVPGKQTYCPSRISFQLAGDRLNQPKFSSDSKKLEVSNYPMLLKIIYEHNQSINSADALRYRPIGEGVKRKLMKTFCRRSQSIIGVSDFQK